VTATAVGLALMVFVLVSLESQPLPVSTDFGAPFLLSLSLMDMAFAYNDYWPVEYTPMYAVMWTLLFGLVTAGTFVGIYELVIPHFGNTIASVGAFVIAVGLQFASAILYARLR
jgi:hypothetical protein